MDTTDKASDKVNCAVKGVKVATEGYKIMTSAKGTTAVKVINTNIGRMKNGVPKGEWVITVHTPHRGAPYNHLKINQAVSGFKDPRIQISPAALNSAESAAKFAKSANKVLLPLAVAVDAGRCGYAVYRDVKNGTSRNTMETAASVAGGWGGGYGGCVAGAALGTAVLPVVGTMLGGVVGGIVGGITGSWMAEKCVSEIADDFGYETEECTCDTCNCRYKRHKHKNGEPDNRCPRCRREV